jgi:hypothetical protein
MIWQTGIYQTARKGIARVRNVLPDELCACMTAGSRYGLSALAAAGPALALALFLLIPGQLHSQEHIDITGQVVNGTAGGATPHGLDITLHVIGPGGGLWTASTVTDGDGRFRFDDVEVDEASTYAVTTSYQDILYSAQIDPSASVGPVEMLVYETTNDISSLRVSADALMIRNSGQDERMLTALEAVALVNDGDRTIVPDLARPQAMNFMRFSLAEGATGLEVSSNLPDGDIISVGTGFALTSPVTPGAHQVNYRYLIPYEGSAAEFSHSFPMGADTFRLLIEDGLGNFQGTDTLAPLEPVDAEGTVYSVWQAEDMDSGHRLTLEIAGLPQPPAIQRLGDTLTDGPYLKVGLPVAVGIVLAALLLYALAIRRPIVPATPQGAPGTAATQPVGTAGGPEEERRTLVEAIADLDNLSQQDRIPPEDYHRRRQELKAQLLRLAVILEERQEGRGRT